MLVIHRKRLIKQITEYKWHSGIIVIAIAVTTINILLKPIEIITQVIPRGTRVKEWNVENTNYILHSACQNKEK